MTTNVRCPACDTWVEWSASSPFRPFCSERCKLVDLSGWMSEAYRVADDDSAPGEASDTAGDP